MIIFLLVIMVFCYAFQSLFCRFYAQNYSGEGGTRVSSLVFAVIFGMFIGLATLAANGFSFSPSRLTMGFGLLNAVMLVAFHLSQIGAAARGSFAIMNICMLFGGILIPMLVSVVKLGQRLTWLQILAVLLMLVAFILLNCRGLSLGETKPGYWLYCAALALSNGIYGSLLSLQAGLMEGAERTEMIAVSYIGSAILAFLAVLAVRRGKAIGDFRMNGRALGWAFGCCVVATIAANIALYLLSKLNTTVFNTVDNGGVLLLSALFAFLFFGERPSRLQYCGLGAALGSIVLLSL